MTDQCGLRSGVDQGSCLGHHEQNYCATVREVCAQEFWRSDDESEETLHGNSHNEQHAGKDALGKVAPRDDHGN